MKKIYIFKERNMPRLLDPVLDFFIQIPFSEGNILKFLEHNGFKSSIIQSKDGETKNILFYHTSLPKKITQIQETKNGVENFLYTHQKTFFLVLQEYEITFLLRTPNEEHGIAIEIQNEKELYPARKVQHSGEEKITGVETSVEKSNFTLKTNDNTLLGQQELQDFFMSFIVNKEFLSIEELSAIRLEREMTLKNEGVTNEWLS